MSSDRRPLLIFTHVSKTAGSTLWRILQREYGKERVLLLYPGEREEWLRRWEAASRPDPLDGIEVVAGHVCHGIHRYFGRAVRYVALVRDPVERVYSCYRHVRRKAGHPLHQAVAGTGMSFLEFLESDLTWKVENQQARCLSGSVPGTHDPRGPGGSDPAILDEARARIEADYEVVGPSERFDEFLALCRMRLGWRETGYWPVNVDPVRGSRRVTERRDELEPAAVERVRALNRLDSDLYDWIEARFDRQVDAAGGAFGRELLRHRLAKVRWKSRVVVRVASAKGRRALAGRGR